MKGQHFLSMRDVDSAAIMRIFAIATKLKHQKTAKKFQKLLSGKTLVMMFEKPSLRTRLSFETGMTQLGGHAVYLGPSDIGIGTRECISDIAKVASSMGDLLMARVYSHATVFDLANYATVPVINGLSDWEHPCQALSDLFTIYEIKKQLKGVKLAFLGDGENNITHSWVWKFALPVREGIL
jgi:ornithine carbamoyltransferase